MLNSEKIIVSTKAHKVEKFDTIVNYVRFLVRHTELEKITSNKDFTSARSKIENTLPDTDALTVPEEKVREILTDDAVDFLAKREELLALKEELAKIPVGLSDFNALGTTDRTFIILQAHTAMKSIKLDETVFEGIDLESPIQKFYSSGTMKGVKDMLRSIFSKIVGTEGELFYGVKLRKSDFSDLDVRNFLAYFGGKAQRTTTKKDGITVGGAYKWVDKSGDKASQSMSTTNLFAVVLDSEKDYEVLKEA